MQNKIIIVFGKKGSGKTTFVKECLLPRFDKLIIVDTLAEYHNGVIIDDIPSLVDYLLRNFRGNYRIVFRGMHQRGEQELPFNVFTLAWSSVGSTIVIEELDYYCSATKKDFDIERLLRYGRHRLINVIGISRRAAEVPKTITSQADIIVSFGQQEPRDLAYMGALTSSEFSEELRKLSAFQFRVYATDSNASQELGLQPFNKPQEKRLDKEEPID